MNPLFSPFQLGNLTLPHRVIMAPLTRSRAGQPGNVPTQMNVEYYRQRASAALVITEATQITQQGQGYAWTPGIHSKEQIRGWRNVAKAVHDEGGRIFMQLWHVGRVSHPCFQPDGDLPVAPSALEVPGQTFILNEQGEGQWADVPIPRALNVEEIKSITQDYVQAARNAIEAGMDGVEIHAGNGYLIDSFINSNSNVRTDEYGGTSENRARFLLEVVDAVSNEIGAARVAVRMTPQGRFMGMGDETPLQTFGHIAAELDRFGLAYLHLVEPRMINFEKDESFDYGEQDIIELMRSRFTGPLVLAGGYDKGLAEIALDRNRGDAIAFGRGFIANPDFPSRLQGNHALNEPDYDRFYGGDARGYIDYPALPITPPLAM